MTSEAGVVIVMAIILGVVSLGSVIGSIWQTRRWERAHRDMLNRFMAGDWREYATYRGRAEEEPISPAERTKQIKEENALAERAMELNKEVQKGFMGRMEYPVC